MLRISGFEIIFFISVSAILIGSIILLLAGSRKQVSQVGSAIIVVGVIIFILMVLIIRAGLNGMP